MIFWKKWGDPVDPLNRQGGETLEQYLDRQGFKHFTGAEICRYFSAVRYGVSNEEPPIEYWPNFVPVLNIVDDLREVLGCPVRITSSYRCPAYYNKVVGGAQPRPGSVGSQHLYFRAADIQADGATPHEVYQILANWRQHGRFKGGLGLYPDPKRRFVHIDNRGRNATW
jgi:hypothetical protein